MDKEGKYSVPKQLLTEILKEFEGGSVLIIKQKNLLKKSMTILIL